MDLVDRIETTRFLGSEFVLWLWFSRDVTDGLLKLPKLGAVELELGVQLVLADPLAAGESVHVRGLDPCGSAEAGQALLSGKLPRKIGLRLLYEGSEWVLTLDAATLGASGVKLPALLSEGEEEQFHERMRLLEQLTDLVRALYAHFLGVRLAPAWEAELVPAMRRWLADGSTLELAQYESLHASETSRPHGATRSRAKSQRRRARQ